MDALAALSDAELSEPDVADMAAIGIAEGVGDHLGGLSSEEEDGLDAVDAVEGLILEHAGDHLEMVDEDMI